MRKTGIIQTVLLLLLAVPLMAAEPAPQDEQPEIREREIYVPYEEFLKIVAKDPHATVMSLAEYRNLVLLATANRLKKKAALPPQRGVVAEVSYAGNADDSSARFDARFKVSVSGDKWVVCDLGQLPASLGRVTLDDKPAWLVKDGGKTYLLVKGAGLHQGGFSFTLPLHRDEDVLRMQTPLPRASASVMQLSVPGRAEGEADVPLEARFDAEANRTHFQAGLGRSERLSLKWKARHDVEKNKSLLLVRQRIAYHLLPDRPEFRWEADVQIARRKTDRVAFRLPENLRLVRLTGAGVQAWHIKDGLLHVVLDQPKQGALALSAQGIVALQGATLPLSSPALQEAAQDTRHISLWEPDETRLAIRSTRDARELAPGDVKATGFSEAELSRVFLVTGANPRVELNISDWSLVFDTRSAFDLVIDEKSTVLTAACQVSIERGRFYAARLVVPAPWQLVSVREAGTGRGLSAERVSEQNGEVWQLKLVRAAEAERPFAFSAMLRVKQAEDAPAEWEQRALALATPRLEGARRSSAQLALRVAPPIDVAFGAMPAWRTEEPARLAVAGLNRRFLRAGLTTETAGAPLNITLTRREPRGVYEAVTHVLTFEKKAWIRCDIRLSVLDRALEEMVVKLPEGVPETVHILGPGVKEIAGGAHATERRVRFAQPWLGVRIFRVEYRTDIAPDTDLTVPDIALEGNFDARRRVVFQSAGAVELVPPKPGPGLDVATLDETPEFAQPFREGRALYAFILRAGQPAGTYRTTIFEQSKVLGSAVGVMSLVTVLDGSGISRTHAAFEYHYSRDQYLRIELPEGAKLLAVSVGDRNVQPVQDETVQGAHAIPLPPLTVVRIELAYERELNTWGKFGTWREAGPKLLDVPVGETRWRLYHATGWDCRVSGGNLQAARPVPPAYFANTFWSRLAGRPRFTTLERPTRQRPVTEFEMRRPIKVQQEQVRQQSVQAIEVQQRKQAEDLRAFGALALPEGVLVEASKLGGRPEYVLSYQERSYAQFAKRLSCLVAMLIALWLAVTRSSRALVAYIAVGLLAGTLLPPAIGWSSPLLVVPFCEGLVFAALLALLRGVVWLIGSIQRRSRTKKVVVASILILLVLFGTAVRAQEATPVIPYPPDDVTKPDVDPIKRKVYVPRARFLELMKWAHPDDEEESLLPQLPGVPRHVKSRKGRPQPKVDRGVRMSVGNAHYEMTIGEKTWEARGTIDVRTFDPEDWVKVPLRFNPLHLVSATLNGQPAAIAVAGAPYVPVKGAGIHKLAVTLRGPLELSPGRARLGTQLMGGSAAARLVLRLPSNVELDQKGKSIWVRKETGEQICEMDLGAGGAVALSWRAPDIRAPQTVQIASRSLSLLGLQADGYSVTRMDRVTVEGPGVEVLSYRMVGEWEIVNATAANLAEWAVSGQGAERRLRLWFRKPVNSVQVHLSGRAPLGVAADEAAGLVLENAVRQAGFISLAHGGGRRFTAESLSVLKRTSWAQAQRDLGFNAPATGDRLYLFNEPQAGLRVAAEWEQGKTAVETRATGVVSPDRLTVCVRTRYASGDPMPFRHEVDLPDGWEILTVRGNLLRDWEIVQVGGTRRLVAFFTRRASKGTEVVWTAERRLEIPAEGALNLNLPLPRTRGIREEQVDWILGADPALSLRRAEGTDLRPWPLARASTWVKLSGADEYRMAFRALKGEGQLNIDVERMGSLARADVVCFVQPATDYVQVNAHARFDMEKAGLDTFEFLLPASAKLIDLSARNLKERRIVEAEGGVRLTVLLQSPARGRQTIDLAYRLPREPEQDVAVAGPVVTSSAIKRQGHFVGLVRIAQGPFVVAEPKGLRRKVDIEELPVVPAHVSSGSLTAAYVADAGWAFTVKQPDVEVRKLPDAEISLAELLTVLSADGQVRSVATYTVRNRAKQFLRVALPAEATLWGVLVDGKPVTVSRNTDPSGQRVLGVPIQRLTEADLPLKVAVYYAGQPLKLPALARGFTPRAPRVLETNVVKTLWQVYVPSQYQTTVTDGNMEEVVESLLHGERVKANVDEVNRLLQMNKKPESASQRKRVLSSLQRQQQELSDNFVQLDNNLNRSNDEDVQRLGNLIVDGQNKVSQGYRVDAQNAQKQLKGLQAQMEQAEAELAAQERQQVLDAYNFLGNHWRGGSRYKAKAVEEKTQLGNVPLESLKYPRAFGGFGQANLPEPGVTRTDAKPRHMRAEPVWRTDTDRAVLAGHAGAELRVPTRGRLYAYQCVEGQPEMSMMLRSKPSTWRWGARTALVVFLVLGLLLRRRFSKPASDRSDG